MSNKISRTEAIGLIAAAIGTVYNECFQEQKSELCAGVRKAKSLGDALRAKEKRSHKIVNDLMEANGQIVEISEEAEQVLNFFDEMIAASEYDSQKLMDDLKNYSIRVAKMEHDMKSMQRSQLEEINEIREAHYAEIRDYERALASKDRVISSNSNVSGDLKKAQQELGALRIKYNDAMKGYAVMEKNFKSNANKLIDRIQEVNHLKEEVKELKKKKSQPVAETVTVNKDAAKQIKDLQKELKKTQKELDMLQCKCGSIDYARNEWKRRYQELEIMYQSLHDTMYESSNHRKAA